MPIANILLVERSIGIFLNHDKLGTRNSITCYYQIYIENFNIAKRNEMKTMFKHWNIQILFKCSNIQRFLFTLITSYSTISVLFPSSGHAGIDYGQINSWLAQQAEWYTRSYQHIIDTNWARVSITITAFPGTIRSLLNFSGYWTATDFTGKQLNNHCHVISVNT